MYTLPASVDVYWKGFAVPAAQIPTGPPGQVAGLPFLQFNERRVGLLLCNPVANNHAIFIHEKEFGFSQALPLHNGIGNSYFYVPWPPRNQLYVWKGTGAVPEFSYVEFIMQPFRQGVSPEQGGGIRSNVQNA